MRLRIRCSVVILPSRKYLEMTGAFLEIAIQAAKFGEQSHNPHLRQGQPSYSGMNSARGIKNILRDIRSL